MGRWIERIKVKIRYLNAVVALLLTFIAGVQSATNAHARQDAPLFGVYLWGGMLDGPRNMTTFFKSVSFLLEKGVKAIRFTVTPASTGQYGAQLCSFPDKMTCVLRQFLDDDIILDQRLKTIMVTLHDFDVSGDVMISSLKLNANKDKMINQYKNSLNLIGERFKGSGKTVIISNWEGDNVIYCGGAFRYATNAEFANRCRNNKAGSIIDRADGFIEWVQFRDKLIQEFAKTVVGFELIHAPELNNVFIFRDSCRHYCNSKATVKSKISETGRVGACSYSAYDSFRSMQLNRALSDLSQICSTIIIGEIGMPDRVAEKGDFDRTIRSAIDQFQSVDKRIVPLVFVWNAFEDKVSRDPGFGLFDGNGADRQFEYWKGFIEDPL